MLNRYDVYTADEAFFTGTASEVVGDPPGGRPDHRQRQAWAGHPRSPDPFPGAGAELTTPAALAIFLHAPRLGTVKHRLAAELGDRHALRLYRIMVARTLAAAREAGLEATVWFTPADAGPETRYWLGESGDCALRRPGISALAHARRDDRARESRGALDLIRRPIPYWPTFRFDIVESSMVWRVVEHADRQWNVTIAAERRANSAQWNLVFSFRCRERRRRNRSG